MTKTPSSLARLLNISTPSLRRWCSEYAAYLSPAATPPKGKLRTFSEHDERVFLLIANLRQTGLERDEIIARLDAEQSRGWQGLPELPTEFATAPYTISADEAASRAYEMAQVATLQTQIQYLQQQNQGLSTALETARNRVIELETELEKIHQESATTERGLREELLQIERQKQTALFQAQAEVSRLEGQLSSYSLGREKPLNVGLLLIGAVLFGVALVVVVFVVANLIN